MTINTYDLNLKKKNIFYYYTAESCVQSLVGKTKDYENTTINKASIYRCSYNSR